MMYPLLRNVTQSVTCSDSSTVTVALTTSVRETLATNRQSRSEGSHSGPKNQPYSGLLRVELVWELFLEKSYSLLPHTAEPVRLLVFTRDRDTFSQFAHSKDEEEEEEAGSFFSIRRYIGNKVR